jgi:tellurite resistance protein TerC
VFVGLKMVWLNDLFGGKFPVLWSLGIIGSILMTSIVLSWVIKPKLRLDNKSKLSPDIVKSD